MDKIKTQLDGGTLEENIAEIKEFCGLRPDQSFDELEIDEQASVTETHSQEN